MATFLWLLLITLILTLQVILFFDFGYSFSLHVIYLILYIWYIYTFQFSSVYAAIVASLWYAQYLQAFWWGYALWIAYLTFPFAAVLFRIYFVQRLWVCKFHRFFYVSLYQVPFTGWPVVCLRGGSWSQISSYGLCLREEHLTGCRSVCKTMSGQCFR